MLASAPIKVDIRSVFFSFFIVIAYPPQKIRLSRSKNPKPGQAGMQLPAASGRGIEKLIINVSKFMSYESI
jgi:hypothetical protein